MPRKRKSGDGGLYYDKKRDLWIGVVDIGLTPDGRRKQKRVSSRSQTTARTKLRNLQAEIEATGSPLGSQTVASWGEYWLDGICKPKMKPQPFRTYRSVLNTWVIPAIGRKNLKDVRPSDLRDIYAHMKDEGKSTSTALKAHIVISSMFESARLERLVSTNVAQDIRPPKAVKTTRGTFEPEQTRAILREALHARHGTKWEVSLDAGIRQGERLGATLDSVDLERGLFTVRWNLVEANYDHGCKGTCGRKAAGHCPQKRLVIPEGIDYRVLEGRIMLVPPKSGEARTFPLSARLLERLHSHMLSLTLDPNPHGLLWPAANGSPMTSRADQAEWRALLVAAKVDNPGATTHWARHTAISDMAASAIADRTIGATVGHKSPGVTGNYTHTASADALEAMSKLEARRQQN